MKLLETIEQAFRSVNNPAPHELRSIILKLELTPGKVAPYIEEPSSLPYGRKLLHQSDHAEVILIHMPQGSQTFIHDHGASVGCALIVEGRMTNAVYRVDSYGYACESGDISLQEQQFLFAPRGQVHQMRNAGPSRMISFHVYAPRLTDTKTYRTYEQVLDYVI
jgi:cysteine dioxygenase